MIHASAARLGEKKKASTRYRNPPVHEVIIDVQFHRSLDEKALGDVRERLSKSFPQVEQMNLVQLEMAVGVTPYQNMVRQFGGWQFKRDGGLACRSIRRVVGHLSGVPRSTRRPSGCVRPS
jgi:hypothetical protein